MKLDGNQQKQVIDALNLHLLVQGCSVCKHSDWEVNDTVFEMREFFGGNMVIGPSSIVPVIYVMCKNCGNSLLFNALRLGIVQTPQEKKK